MKRIVFTVTNDLVFDQRMIKICSSLTGMGYDVTLTGRELRRSPELQRRAFRQKRLKCFFNKGKLFYIEYNIRLFLFLLFIRTDIYSAVDLDTILPCLFAARFRNKKLVYDAHEFFTEVPEVKDRPFIKKIWSVIEKFSVPKTDACYTVSSSYARLFEEQYGKPFQLILNVPHLKPLPEDELADRARFILYQGALNKGRGLEQLIEAMKELPLQLKIAGEGDMSVELRRMVKNLALEDKVEFLGRVSPDKLKELTPQAFIGYNLMENLGLSYYYSLSNKFFDYMHALVPGISNDFPEYRNVNNGIEVALLIDMDTTAIVDAVNSLMNNPEKYRKLKQNCSLARERYNWQHEELKLAKIYSEL